MEKNESSSATTLEMHEEVEVIAPTVPSPNRKHCKWIINQTCLRASAGESSVWHSQRLHE